MIDQMSLNDLSKVAQIHLDVYGKEHFTSHFTHKMLVDYYLYLLNAADCALVSRNRENINGFLLAGTKINNGVQHFIRSNRKQILFILLKKPTFLFDKLKQYLFPQESYQSTAKFRLLSIAIAENAQGSSVAKSLISALST